MVKQGIPPVIYNHLESTLSKCGPFDSHSELKAIFVDARLSLWKNQLPEANNRAGRIRMVIEYLYNKHNDSRENALVLLLQVLSERTDSYDACHKDLVTLKTELKKELE